MRSGKKSRLRWLEYLFLICGLVAVDYYIWVNVESTVYQVYQDWKFERSLRGEDAPLARFMVDQSGFRRIFGLGVPPERMARPNNAEAAKPSEPPRRQHERDEVLGRLEIPRLNIRAIVREGDDASTLSHAVGHIPSTVWPGELGNVALAAHRDTFFRPLRNIRKNDRIVVATLNGNYEYVVESTQIVSPTDVSVLKASDEHELTLVTCFPFYYVGSAPHRFIVHARQVSATAQPQPQIGS